MSCLPLANITDKVQVKIKVSINISLLQLRSHNHIFLDPELPPLPETNIEPKPKTLLF